MVLTQFSHTQPRADRASINASTSAGVDRKLVTHARSTCWSPASRTGEKLEFEENYHWHPATVDLVARTIIESVGEDFMVGRREGEEEQ